MDKFKGFIFVLLPLILLPVTSYSHPGRTASDGCHYCRTNCDRWGVPWNVRHCHNGYKHEQSISDIHSHNLAVTQTSRTVKYNNEEQRQKDDHSISSKKSLRANVNY